MEVSLVDLDPVLHQASEIDDILKSPMTTHPHLVRRLWLKFDEHVRQAHALATQQMRDTGASRDTRDDELLRLLEIEEQTRCQAFQVFLLGETHKTVYVATVRSILEKLLAKLETWAAEPLLYRSAAQALSGYMSALNHHCDTCVGLESETSPIAAADGAFSQLSAIQELDLEANLEGIDTASTCSYCSDSTQASMQSRSDRGAAGSTVGASGAPAGTPHALPTVMAASSAPPSKPAAKSRPAAEEERKQRRREVSRISSLKYRSRKAQGYASLMEENTTLKQQLVASGSTVNVLIAENNLLKQQVNFLQGLLQKDRGLSAMPIADE